VGSGQEIHVGNNVGIGRLKEKGTPGKSEIPFVYLAVPAGFEPAFSP